MKTLFDNCKTEYIKSDGLSMHDLCGSCAECVTLHSKEFNTIFGVDLKSFMSGIHYISGFDIIRFDRCVIQSGGDCMSDCIIEKHGKRASDLIAEILQYPKV